MKKQFQWNRKRRSLINFKRNNSFKESIGFKFGFIVIFTLFYKDCYTYNCKNNNLNFNEKKVKMEQKKKELKQFQKE